MANMRVFIFTTLQDLRYFKSDKTSRGILQEGWRDTQDPIMCSYKLVTVKFEVWGLQTRVEQFVHKVRACPWGMSGVIFSQNIEAGLKLHK